jgi:hypothetical protein
MPRLEWLCLTISLAISTMLSLINLRQLSNFKMSSAALKKKALIKLVRPSLISLSCAALTLL